MFSSSKTPTVWSKSTPYVNKPTPKVQLFESTPFHSCNCSDTPHSCLKEAFSNKSVACQWTASKALGHVHCFQRRLEGWIISFLWHYFFLCQRNTMMKNPQACMACCKCSSEVAIMAVQTVGWVPFSSSRIIPTTCCWWAINEKCSLSNWGL